MKISVVPNNSTVGGTVEIAVLACTPVISKEEDSICANIDFVYSKKATDNYSRIPGIPFGFGFRVAKTVCFRKCAPSKLREIDPSLLKGLECRVIDISTIEDLVTLHPSAPGTTGASFDELLKIKLQLMLVQQKRISVLVCPPESVCPPEPICPPKRVCYPVSVCPPQKCKYQGTVLPPTTCCFSYLSCSKAIQGLTGILQG